MPLARVFAVETQKARPNGSFSPCPLYTEVSKLHTNWFRNYVFFSLFWEPYREVSRLDPKLVDI